MRTPTRAAIVLLTISALVGLGGAAASAGNEASVEICHRTTSNANPYVTPPPNQSGQNGGTDHFNEHTGPLWNPDLKKQKIEWGDLIPPSADHPEGSEAYQELADTQAWKDFVAEGGTFAAFVAGVDGDDCRLPDAPEVPTHDVTLDKVSTGETAPSADTVFTFTVVCDSGDVTSPVSVAAEDDAVLVAEGVAEDDLCTITETVSNGAESVDFAVTGGSVDSEAPGSVTVAVGADTAVVATNDYADAAAPTGDVTLDKVVTGESAPDPATTYDFSVVCDSGTATSPVSIASTQDAVLVADDVELGDRCTVTETGANDADDIDFAVTGGTVGTTTDTSVTFTVDAAIVEVVATNDFPSVAGVVLLPPQTVEPAQLPATGFPVPHYTAAGMLLLVAGALARTVSQLRTADIEA